MVSKDLSTSVLSVVTLTLHEREILGASDKNSRLRGEYSRHRKPSRDAKYGVERTGRGVSLNRPFSASLISPKREKTRTRPMSAQRPSQFPDARGLSSATFRKRTKTHGRIPEYDGVKVIAESSAARNKALAAEYIAMLQGRNYMKKQYREQYWVNDVTESSRPPAGRYSREKRNSTLYPDLGSVIGGRTPCVTGTPATARSPPNSATRWRLSASSTSSINTPCSKGGELTKSLPSESSSTTVIELGHSIGSKKSWSNVPSGKCYRILSHPNDTMASLCLEGRSPSRTSNSRTSSMSSITAAGEKRRALSSTGESTRSGSSETIGGKFQMGSGDEDQVRSLVFGGADLSVSNNDISKTEDESDRELSVTHGLTDAVFEDYDSDAIPNKDEEVGDDLGDEEYDENPQEVATCRLSYSDLEESDISENEADDYDEEVVDKDEVNRRLQQVSAVFETSRASPSHDLETLPTIQSDVDSTSEVELSEDEDDAISNESQTDDQPHEYEFAEFLPTTLAGYDLSLFAALPAGMDWRTFLQPVSVKKEQQAKSQFRKSETDRRRAERRSREREAKKRKVLEDTVDRLIMLEKLQGLTVQYEQDRKRHLLHRAKARSASKAASNAQNMATSSNSTNNELRPQSARSSRRRGSIVSATPANQPSPTKTKKSFSSSELRNESGLNKPSLDLDLVRLSCSKNHLQFLRLSSVSGRRRAKFGLPRHYEYSWSERVPPSKRPSLNSLLYTKPRNCPSCRESEKRLAQVHTVQQMMLARPRSSYGMFSSEQQKLHQRPNTTNAPVRSTKNNSQNAKDNRPLNKDRTENENPKLRSSTRDIATPAAFGRVTAKNSTTRENISAARAILSTVARDYARAAKKGGGISRRSSAPNIAAARPGWSSPPGVIRYRRDANVLKTQVIDSTNVRLK